MDYWFLAEPFFGNPVKPRARCLLSILGCNAWQVHFLGHLRIQHCLNLSIPCVSQQPLLQTSLPSGNLFYYHLLNVLAGIYRPWITVFPFLIRTKIRAGRYLGLHQLLLVFFFFISIFGKLRFKNHISIFCWQLTVYS